MYGFFSLLIKLVTIVVICFIIIVKSVKAQKQKSRQQADIDTLLKKIEADKKERKAAFENQRIEDLHYFHEKIFVLSPELLAAWGASVHDVDSQLNRQLISLYEPICFCFCRELKEAIFTGYITKNKFLVTSLKKCSCDYFEKNKRPCEHIYRLSLFLNHNDTSDCPETDATIYERFKSLSFDCRLHYIDTMYYLSVNGRDYLQSQFLREESEAGLLILSNDLNYPELLKKMTKDEIILWLSSCGITGCSFNWSKARVIAWAIEHAHDLLEQRFSTWVHVSLPPEFLSWQEKFINEMDHSTYSHPHFWHEACHKMREKDNLEI